MICDADRRILWASVLTVGSTHDGTAFGSTLLARILKDPDHPIAASPYFICGDDAYKGCANKMHSSLLTPFSGRKVDRPQDAFNYAQSSCRITSGAPHACMRHGGGGRG